MHVALSLSCFNASFTENLHSGEDGPSNSNEQISMLSGLIRWVTGTIVLESEIRNKFPGMVHILHARPSGVQLFKRTDRVQQLAVARKVNVTRTQRFASGQGEAQSSDDDEIPANCSRYKVKISKPLGLVLEEDRSGAIFVAEVLPGGNAERLGMISPRDQLIATSGFIRTTEQVYGQTVVQGMQPVCWWKTACRGR
jgi:hypothetical protein